ncbi:hypothetical protein Glove_117g502 [Diversispora epigaea]|uniref:Uncharacterized protein n=1 Tax=Diversispora epigaea TaxID=1348612 RepID=A0A397J977_9GLOM|nr:hypothetical protein Glove_117g502 [Diversispora epigaea]
MVKEAFSSERFQLSNQWVCNVLVCIEILDSCLPFTLASNISVQDYNSFIENQELSGCKFEYKNDIVYIVEMGFAERGAVVETLGNSFRAVCPSTTYVTYNNPIKIHGSPCKGIYSSLLDLSLVLLTSLRWNLY